MTYALTAEKDGEILRARATGKRTLETVLGLMRDIYEMNAQHRCSMILVDIAELEGRLKTLDSFELVTTGFSSVRDGAVVKCAIVVGTELDDNYGYLENLAVNRGFNLKMFESTKGAEEWLRK